MITRKTFKDEVLNNIKLRAGSNLQLFINESTILILKAIKENKEIKEIQPPKIEIGRFYIIKYNYNGNTIWCPIFTLEYKFYNNKNILYAMNLDYLPYLYKINFFNFIWLKQKEIFKFNVGRKIEEEKNLKDVNFEVVYNLLKKFGNHEYCITAFDIKKLKKVFVVSYNILGRLIFFNTKNLNSKSMKELYDEETNEETKEKIKNIAEGFQKILDEYSEDSKEFYKKLKAYETHFKLTENEK